MIQILLILTASAICFSAIILIKANYKKTLAKSFNEIMDSMVTETNDPEKIKLISEIKHKLINKLNNL